MNTSLLPLIRTQTGPPVIRHCETAAPACPFCHSTEVRRLSGLARAGAPLPASEEADRSQRGLYMGIFKSPSYMGMDAQTRRMVPSPVPRGTRVFLLALMALGLVGGVLALVGRIEVGYGIFAMIMAVVAGLSFVQCFSDERNFANRMKRWDNSWCCLHCGRSFLS